MQYAIIVLAQTNTIALTAHVALVLSTLWFSTKNATGISVDEIVEVTEAIDINTKNNKPTNKPNNQSKFKIKLVLDNLEINFYLILDSLMLFNVNLISLFL